MSISNLGAKHQIWHRDLKTYESILKNNATVMNVSNLSKRNPVLQQIISYESFTSWIGVVGAEISSSIRSKSAEMESASFHNPYL